jgi:hypothetical protein
MRPVPTAVALFMSVLPLTLSAQAVHECGWVGNPGNIAEPWDSNTRTFANGRIRVALLDTGGEPACCSVHLLILSPSGQDEGPEYRQCRVVSDQQEGIGFSDLDLAGIAASYDPARGLRLDVPVWRYIDGTTRGTPGRVAVRINQATGSVAIER